MAGSVDIVFDGLAGSEEPVSPALPRVLQVLARRGVRATFYVPSALGEAEPFALTMIENGGQLVERGDPPAGDTVAGRDSAPGEWHSAMQLAVGRAVGGGGHATLVFAPSGLERGDAMGFFDETIDLVAGLRRAGSLTIEG